MNDSRSFSLASAHAMRSTRCWVKKQTASREDWRFAIEGAWRSDGVLFRAPETGRRNLGTRRGLMWGSTMPAGPESESCDGWPKLQEVRQVHEATSHRLHKWFVGGINRRSPEPSRAAAVSLH